MNTSGAYNFFQKKFVFEWRLSSTKGCLLPKVVFHHRLSSTKGYLPPNVVFHRRMSSIECCLPPKVIIHRRSSSTKGHLPPKVVLHQMSSSTKGRLPLNVIFHQRSSSTKSCLPPKCILHWRLPSTKVHPPPKIVFRRMSSSTLHNTLVDLIFVRTVNIPNLILLPCFERLPKFFGQSKRRNETNKCINPHVGSALHLKSASNQNFSKYGQHSCSCIHSYLFWLSYNLGEMSTEKGRHFHGAPSISVLLHFFPLALLHFYSIASLHFSIILWNLEASDYSYCYTCINNRFPCLQPQLVAVQDTEPIISNFKPVLFSLV